MQRNRDLQYYVCTIKRGNSYIEDDLYTQRKFSLRSAEGLIIFKTYCLSLNIKTLLFLNFNTDFRLNQNCRNKLVQQRIMFCIISEILQNFCINISSSQYVLIYDKGNCVERNYLYPFTSAIRRNVH